MAAPTTGHRRTDHLRTMHLCEVAADFAISVLRPGGHFLAKTFQGGTETELLARLKQHFRFVHHVKPPASRDESVELYLLAREFKGREPKAHGSDLLGLRASSPSRHALAMAGDLRTGIGGHEDEGQDRASPMMQPTIMKPQEKVRRRQRCRRGGRS